MSISINLRLKLFILVQWGHFERFNPFHKCTCWLVSEILIEKVLHYSL